MTNIVKSALTSMIAIPDLLGGLLDEDTSSRVRGVLIAILFVLAGWFAKDFFTNTLTQGDLVPLIAQQKVQQRLIEGQMRRQCRQDTALSPVECERIVEGRVNNVESQVTEDFIRNQ